LHDLFAPGVFAHQLEEEVLAFKVVAAAQDAFDDLRDRLVLINAELAASPKQGQARLQSDFVAGFINGAGQAFEAGNPRRARRAAVRSRARSGRERAEAVAPRTD
jgi:hypothetical protein